MDTLNSLVGFAGIAAATIGSIGLALGLEWLALHWLIRAMPHHSHAAPASRPVAEFPPRAGEGIEGGKWLERKSESSRHIA